MEDQEMTLTERIHLAGERLTATEAADIKRLSAIIGDLTTVMREVVSGLVEQKVEDTD